MELLIYASLLSIVATSIFSLAYQINKKNQKNLVLHTNLNTMQIALDLLIQDLRQSLSIELKRNHQLNLNCKTSMGIVQWKLSEKILLRIDHQTKLKKPITAKVAENIIKITVLRTKNKLIKVVIMPENNILKMERVVLLRREMKI